MSKAACFFAIVFFFVAGGQALPAPQDTPPANHCGSGLHPSRSTERLEKARESLRKGQTSEAIALLREIVRDRPRDGDAHLLLGDALAALAMRSEALRELQQGVALEPRSAVAYFSLGNAEARFADLDAARGAFERAVALDPGFIEAHVSLALVLAQQKQFDSAKDNLARAIELTGDKPAAAYPHYLLAQVLASQGHPHQALEQLDAAIALRPSYAEAHLRAGLIESNLHKNARAIGEFEEAASLNPNDAEAEYLLGGAYLRSNMGTQAVEPLKKAVAMMPGDRKSLYQLCEAFRMAGRREEASHCQQKLSILVRQEMTETDNIAAAGNLNNEGVALEKARNLAAAVEKYRAAVKLNPRQTVFRRNLALALCRQGNWKEGAAELNEVLKENPEDTETTKALYIALDRIHQASSYSRSSGANAK